MNHNSTIVFCAHLGVDALKISVGLPGAHEHDGLPTDVGHGDGRANLVINCVKLSEHYFVNCVRYLSRVIRKSRIEYDKLVNSFIANKSFPNK